MFSGITGSCEVTLSDSEEEILRVGIVRYFFPRPNRSNNVKITLITINKVAVRAVNLDNKLADPLADIIPPNTTTSTQTLNPHCHCLEVKQDITKRIANIKSELL